MEPALCFGLRGIPIRVCNYNLCLRSKRLDRLHTREQARAQLNFCCWKEKKHTRERETASVEVWPA